MLPYTGDITFVRKQVAQMLKRAAAALDIIKPGARLKVVYGYRHPDIQENPLDSSSPLLAAPWQTQTGAG
ncbi:MAG: hypothetical protein KKA52_08630, partial [Candidatus Omnitrophica bacterium]|nr:hypothetical protein [Candidatus Omnitrophota bacterium]